jgi:hypothetical protein
MAMMEAAVIRKLAFFGAALALVLSVTDCAAGSASGPSAPGPLASHGVDYIPTFDAPYSGGGGRG